MGRWRKNSVLTSMGAKIRKLLANEVSAQELLDGLQFSGEALERAALEQAPLFVKAASFRVQAMAKRFQFESAVKVLEATLSERLRTEADESGARIVQAEVQAAQQLDSSCSAARKQLQEAELEEEFAKLLLEGYRMRRDSMRIISEQRAVEGRVLQLPRATEDSVRERLKSVRSRLKDR